MYVCLTLAMNVGLGTKFFINVGGPECFDPKGHRHKRENPLNFTFTIYYSVVIFTIEVYLGCVLKASS